MEQKKRTYDKWTDNDVQALLSLFAETEIQSDFESATRNDRVYQKMSNKLAELNVAHTAKQIREKLKKLKQDYKKMKDHNSRSGSDRRTNKWYDQLDAILGHRPAYSGNAATKNTATSLLNTMCQDTHEAVKQWSEVEVDHTDSASFSDAAASGSSFVPSPTNSSHVLHNCTGKRKSHGDHELLDVFREMEEANQELMRCGFEQRDCLLQQIVNTQTEEMELRRQELVFLREDAENARRQEREFQTGFLAVLDRLVQTLCQKP